VGFRAGLDDTEKRKFLAILGLELRTLGHPACRQALYRSRLAQDFYLKSDKCFINYHDDTPTRRRVLRDKLR
jgi:hypothetical protein